LIEAWFIEGNLARLETFDLLAIDIDADHGEAER
jgi:hypothetical protein